MSSSTRPPSLRPPRSQTGFSSSPSPSPFPSPSPSSSPSSTPLSSKLPLQSPSPSRPILVPRSNVTTRPIPAPSTHTSSSPNPTHRVNPRSKSIFGSFRSLSPNQRIGIGLALGVCALVGMFLDELVPPAEQGSKEAQLAHVAIRIIDKPNS